MKTFINWIIYSWRSVMDNRYNPLRHILDPSIQAYFTLALFIMWSSYFAIVAWTYIGWESYSIVWSIWIHMGVVIPIMITNQVFRDAERDGAKWYKDWNKSDEIFDKSKIEYRDGDNT